MKPKPSLLLPLCCASILVAQERPSVPAGIDRLHRADVAATLADDPQELANLFTNDAVLLEPHEPPQLGRAAILAVNQKAKESHPQARQLEYKPQVHNVRVHGDVATEWTTFTAAFQEDANAPVQRFAGKAARVLQRQPTNPQDLARWTGTKLADGPTRRLQVGDRLVFRAGIFGIVFNVVEVQAPRQLTLDIALPFGVRNHEQIEIAAIDPNSCRTTFN